MTCATLDIRCRTPQTLGFVMSGMEERGITDETRTKHLAKEVPRILFTLERSQRARSRPLDCFGQHQHNHRSPIRHVLRLYRLSNLTSREQRNNLKRTQVRESRFKPRAARAKRLSMFPQLLSKISTLVETWTRMMGKT